MDRLLSIQNLIYLIQAAQVGLLIYNQIVQYRFGRGLLQKSFLLVVIAMMPLNQINMGLNNPKTWTDPNSTTTQYICFLLLGICSFGFIYGFRIDLRDHGVYRAVLLRAQQRFPNLNGERLHNVVKQAIGYGDLHLFGDYDTAR